MDSLQRKLLLVFFALLLTLVVGALGKRVDNRPYVSIEQSEILNDVHIAQNADLKKWDFHFQFLFTGVVLILCLISLILFIITRDNLYLFYLLYAFVTQLFFLYSFDLVETYILYEKPFFNGLLFFSLTLCQPLYAWFLYYALKKEKQFKYHRFLGFYTISVSVIVFGILIYALFRGVYAKQVSDYFLAVNGILIIPFLFYQFKAVSQPNKLIFLGLIFLITAGLITMFLDSVEMDKKHLYIYQTGFFFELVCFTVAILITFHNHKVAGMQAVLEMSKLSNEKMKREMEAMELKKEVDYKNRDLATKAMEISKQEQLLSSITEKLAKLEEMKAIPHQEIKILKNTLNTELKNGHWNEFELHFTSVHPNFYISLKSKYPNLTKGETKLCAFLKLNLSTKEIASISGNSINSIEVSRSRLRKKMGLQTSESLYAIVSVI